MNWWEDLALMRRLFKYDPKTGLIYTRERSPQDFYDTGSGSSFVSAEGAAVKYNLENLGRLAFNCRVKGSHSTCYYFRGSPSYLGKSKNLCLLYTSDAADE